MRASRFFVFLFALSIFFGWLFYKVLRMVNIYFNPVASILLMMLTATILTILTLLTRFGPFLGAFVGSATDQSFQAFVSHYRLESETNHRLLATHTGPRLLLRYIPDPVDFDKAKTNPSRFETTLRALMHFEGASITFRKIELGHGGYQGADESWTGKLIARVNQALPKPREVLAADVVLAIHPNQLRELAGYGLAVGDGMNVATLYDEFAPLPLAAWTEALDLQDGASCLEDADHLPYLATRTSGKVWTVFEMSELSLEGRHSPLGGFERLKRALNAEVQIYFHAFVPNAHEFRRASGVTSVSNLAADWFFREQKGDLPDLQESLRHYKRAMAGATSEKPRLVRGLLLVGRRVARADAAMVAENGRHLAGIDLRPLGRTQQLRAVLSMFPGWEPSARGLGQHGAGHNAAPDEIGPLLTQVAGNWAGDLGQPPYLILETADGESFAWSPWADVAYNALVVGETGSGKSFLLNMILLAHAAYSPMSRSIIIDYGQSFLRLVRALDGQVIDKQGGDCTFAPLACLSPAIQDLAEEECCKILDDAVSITADLWLYRVNLCQFEPPPLESGIRNLFDHYFRQMLRQAIADFSFAGKSFGEVLADSEKFLDRSQNQPDLEQDHRTALTHLRKTIAAMRTLKRSYLSMDAKGLNVAEQGSISYFNLDAFPKNETTELLAIILLNCAQLTMSKSAVPSLLLIDEVKKLAGMTSDSMAETARNPLMQFIAEYLNIVRKYQIAMILSSQNYRHFTPAIMGATQTHIALIQEMAEAPKEWKITDPALIRTASEAAPAKNVKYSTVTLAKRSTAMSMVQVGGRLRTPAIFRELFESNRARKYLAEQVAGVLGCRAEAMAFHTQPESGEYREIGSGPWYAALLEAFPQHAEFLNEAKTQLTEAGFNSGAAQECLARYRAGSEVAS